MLQTSTKSWWLLALCGVLYAMFAASILLMPGADGSLFLRTFLHGRNTASQLSLIAIAAGVCTIAVGIWNLRKGASWLLLLNGVACTAFGLMVGSRGPATFRSIALVIVAMAVSISIYELATARMLRGHLVVESVLGTAGIVSAGFAAVFLGFALRWIQLEPSPSGQTFHWLGSYFGFSAICMLGLALWELRPQTAVSILAAG